MGALTKIQWTDHTWNPWRGCTRISEGCKFCYAERGSLRNPAVLGVWGDRGKRVIAAESYWRLPHRWNAQAESDGRRHRVFSLSLGDWLEEREDLDVALTRMLMTIHDTPCLDWLLLTKRPSLFRQRLTSAYALASGVRRSPAGMISRWLEGSPPENVWIGFSAEDQERFWERLNPARDIPARVHFVSAEPLLGPLDISGLRGIDWIIVGGESESESKARPFDIEWAKSIVDLCRTGGIACFVKQLGSHVEACDIIDAMDYFPGDVRLSPGILQHNARVHLKDPKGGDPAEWPPFLRVREFPKID